MSTKLSLYAYTTSDVNNKNYPQTRVVLVLSSKGNHSGRTPSTEKPIAKRILGGSWSAYAAMVDFKRNWRQWTKIDQDANLEQFAQLA